MAEEQPKELNGLHPEKLEEILKSLEQPEVLKEISGPWRSRVKWQGGFKGRAYTRTHIIDLDEPEGLDATDTAASAHEHILSALGGCMMVGFVLNATRRGIKINDLEIALEGHFENILKWAGLAEAGNPGYGGIKAKIFVSADADEATLREIWKLAIDGSPVTQTVARITEIIPEFEMV